MPTVTVSMVVPVYAGEEYLAELVGAMDEVRNTWEQDTPLRLVEAVFVDDASKDRSLEVLATLREAHPWVKVVTLSRNYGQHPATIAGILRSEGDWVVTLDEDMQHDPRKVIDLFRQAAPRGADVVYAKPERRVHGGLFRDLSSRLYKRLLAWATGNPLVRQFNSFRLVRGAIARAAAEVCGHETYFDIALCWFTDRHVTTYLPLQDRRTKQSGYSLRRLVSHARRAMISSQAKVLRGAALLGGLAVLMAGVLAGRALFLKLFDPSFAEGVRGWTSLFISILFFGGVGCFLLSVALEYLTNVVLHTHGKPAYFVVDRSSDALLVEHFETAS